MILAGIARELKVSRLGVGRWHRKWKRGGSGTVCGAGRSRRKPRVDRYQLYAVVKVLCQGTCAHGFRSGCGRSRAARVIEQLTGVRYHPGHVWKILGTMDWTLQRRTQQAHEHDPANFHMSFVLRQCVLGFGSHRLAYVPAQFFHFADGKRGEREGSAGTHAARKLPKHT